MHRQSRRYRRTWYRRRSTGLYPRDITLPWGHYERYAYTFWRIRIPLWLAGACAGWLVAGAVGVAGGLAAAYALEGAVSFRKVPISSSAPTPTTATPTGDEVAAARAQAARWETDAVPSPGGWRPPAGVLPAWSWLPPDGLNPRFDRVPWWVRLWYKTALVDRYAHVWMWEHGGWDVLPPGPEGDVRET